MSNPLTAEDALAHLTAHADPRRAISMGRYFKTGPGEYGAGDTFLGLSVPSVRAIAKRFHTLSLSETEDLLHAPEHEARLTALLILVHRYQKGAAQERAAIFRLYLSNTQYINNWDLIDGTAEYIVGAHLYGGDKQILIDFAHSSDLWQRRIAMLSCFHDIKLGDAASAFTIVNILKNDSHDLIQKAVGWMLREIGKRCSRAELVAWLAQDDHYKTIPRTALRYAIEHFSPEERQAYLKGGV
ncbi:DNA alkylation repair protein [Capsulimonas corticalis]|uniref:DNA alkylation repair protein n=1 Tax=Capsulimonas corticalis TaxID=2219043 RepID=UPI001C3F5E71|nr:DNA alkylation repair protein [Capsulimonas corticalis]